MIQGTWRSPGNIEEHLMATVRVTPGPPRVQIQTQSGCNGRCVFCPNEATLKSGMPHGKMKPELFEKIIADLAKTPPRRISLYLMNEPLLDKRLPEFVRHTTERIPSTTTFVTTNGTYLKPERAEALIDAGLKRLKVSLQSLDPERNTAIMGYSSEKVIDNILGVRRIIKEKCAKKFDFRVSMVVTRDNEKDVEEARRFWKSHGVRLVTSALENRGGNIAIAQDMNPHEMRVRGDCIRPSREMCILFNGEVVLCCVDWYRTVVLGNVGEQSVQEIWHSPRLQEVREALRENCPNCKPDICVNCSDSAQPNYHRRGLKGFVSRLFGVKQPVA